MIRRVRYKDIDFKKYVACVDLSSQRNFYAKKEILDFLTKNSWELLVEGDYEAVMPIPVKKKFGFSYVYMPLFCQQLGIFSLQFDANVEEQFLKEFEKNYKIQGYFFNEKNTLKSHLEVRKNYIIHPTEYALLRKKYFKGRKSTVKSAQNFSLQKVSFDERIKAFICENFKGLSSKEEVQKYIDYLQFLDSKKLLLLYGATDEILELCNVALLISTKEELSLLGLINKEKYLKKNGASFLIDQIIQKHIPTKSLNMMGGSIRGIEVFFKSFGADCHEYPFIYQSKFDFLRSFLKF